MLGGVVAFGAVDAHQLLAHRFRVSELELLCDDADIGVLVLRLAIEKCQPALHLGIVWPKLRQHFERLARLVEIAEVLIEGLELIERALTAVALGKTGLEDAQCLLALAVALECGNPLVIAGEQQPAGEERP